MYGWIQMMNGYILLTALPKKQVKNARFFGYLKKTAIYILHSWFATEQAKQCGTTPKTVCKKLRQCSKQFNDINTECEYNVS